MTTVVNIRTDDHDVLIGRPSIFGNPFTIKEHGRDECIAKYKYYFWHRLRKDPDFREQVLALKGKALGCYCKPKACHGDVIVAFLALAQATTDKMFMPSA